MYDVVELSYTIIELYLKKTGDYPTSYIVQKMLYFCNLIYMKQNGYKKMFDDDIVCSSGGPCIEKIADIFKYYASNKIIQSEDELRKQGISDEKEIEKIDSIFNIVTEYLGVNVYKDYASLSDKIKSDENGAWNLQRHHDNEIKKQKIEDKYLKQEVDSINL